MAKWILDETYNDGYELLKDDHLYGEQYSDSDQGYNLVNR